MMNRNLEYQQTEQSYLMFINFENQKKEQYSVMFIYKSPKLNQTFHSWGTALKPINILIETYAIAKPDTLVKIFQKTVGEEITYVSLGYGALKHFYNTQGIFLIINYCWSNKVRNTCIGLTVFQEMNNNKKQYKNN